MGAAHETIHRLRFNDTDALGHVNNAVFVVLLEQGRSDLMNLAGLTNDASEYMLVIVRLELDFKASLTWPGEVRIETEVAGLGTSSFRLRQRLLQNGRLCGVALTVMVQVHRTLSQTVTLLDQQRRALEDWLVQAN